MYWSRGRGHMLCFNYATVVRFLNDGREEQYKYIFKRIAAKLKSGIIIENISYTLHDVTFIYVHMHM